VAAVSGVWKTAEIARLDHTFSIDKPPEVAQAMFVRDIAPELAKDRGFQIAREHPGRLIFSDGAVPSADLDSLLEGDAAGQDEPWNVPKPGAVPGAGFTVGRVGLWRSEAGAVDNLAEVLPRHIRVDFNPDGSGTSVHVHGHVEHDVRHGLQLLGTPQHWPEIADRPHD
jgi:hypothetical protein